MHGYPRLLPYTTWNPKPPNWEPKLWEAEKQGNLETRENWETERHGKTAELVLFASLLLRGLLLRFVASWLRCSLLRFFASLLLCFVAYFGACFVACFVASLSLLPMCFPYKYQPIKVFFYSAPTECLDSSRHVADSVLRCLGRERRNRDKLFRGPLRLKRRFPTANKGLLYPTSRAAPKRSKA